MSRSPTMLALVAVLGVALLAGSAAAREPEEIRVDVRIGWDWTPLPASPRSAVRVSRALDGQGRPYDAAGGLACRPADLRRGFHLPKTDYLLGEPITIELRVALEGPGTWQEPVGGNYRAHGRDDNYRLLARAADGTWVEDPYAPFPSFMGGGLGSTVTVKQGAPFSRWLAIQRWVALERPGVYDVYAVHFAHGYDVVGMRAALTAAIPAHLRGEWSLGQDGNDLRDGRGRTGRWRMIPTLHDVPTPSPLVRTMPPELRARLGDQAPAVQDYAHVRITVRAGTAAEIAAMVARAEQAAARPTQRMVAERADATREAIWFTRQTAFLPTLAAWLRGGDRAYYAVGLAMNPAPAATKLLLGDASQEATAALGYLPKANIPLAVPALVARLDAPDDGVRSMSEDLLHRWTGQAFGRTWDGYRLGRPTVAEGRAMRAAYERWWRAHGAGFRAR